MGMFETTGTATSAAARKDNTLRKLKRLKKALRHEEPDRVPISDFFWGSFIRRWRKELGLPDRRQSVLLLRPRLDRHGAEHGPLDPLLRDARGDGRGGRGQDGLRGGPAQEVRLPHARVHRLGDRHPGETRGGRVRRSVRPAALLRGGRQPDCGRGRRFRAELASVGRDGQVALARFPGLRQHGRVLRVHDPAHRSAEPHAVDGPGAGTLRRGARSRRAVLPGLFQGGDRRGRSVAGRVRHLGRRGVQEGHLHAARLLARPTTSPGSRRSWIIVHGKGLDVIYHGCGNVNAIFEDYIETGIDGYNPLEVKAGMDALELRRRFGHRMAFCGNSDIQVWESGDREAIRREVLRKLNAARGGGFIFQSDHSVSSAVSGPTYDYIVASCASTGGIPCNSASSTRPADLKSPESQHDSHPSQSPAWRRLPLGRRLAIGQLLCAAEVHPPLVVGDLLDDPGGLVLADLADHRRHLHHPATLGRSWPRRRGGPC